MPGSLGDWIQLSGSRLPSSLRRGAAFFEQTLLSFGDRKQGTAAREADHNRRYDWYSRFVQTFSPGKVDDHLRAELFLFVRAARSTRHTHLFLRRVMLNSEERRV